MQNNYNQKQQREQAKKLLESLLKTYNFNDVVGMLNDYELFEVYDIKGEIWLRQVWDYKAKLEHDNQGIKDLVKKYRTCEIGIAAGLLMISFLIIKTDSARFIAKHASKGLYKHVFGRWLYDAMEIVLPETNKVLSELAISSLTGSIYYFIKCSTCLIAPGFAAAIAIKYCFYTEKDLVSSKSTKIKDGLLNNAVKIFGDKLDGLNIE